ncbi:MAG TPA: hypothetical protein VF540_01900 [Segetibacter sp.]|jgi:DNA-binding transcriptional MerR regulator
MSVVKLPGQKIDFLLSDKIPEIVHGLRSPVFSLKDTNASSRMMNYYSNQSLLLGNAETKGKRKFNGAQILWISILKDLLATGIPAWVISMIRKDCESFEFYDYNTFNKYFQLEFIASLIVHYKSDIRLIVMPEGSYTFINFSIASNVYKESYYLSNTHISIPLFEKVQQVWKKISEQNIQKRKVIFKEVKADEETVLDALRAAKGEVDEVVIYLKKQEVPQSIMVHEKIDPKTIDSLCKFLRDCKHCKVEIAYGDTSGEPTYLKKSKSIKLPKEG